jgi:ketosteroid isomerase-like protein
MDTLSLARRFIEAVEAGDVPTARSCLADDALIWHNFDEVEQTVDQNMALLEWMMGRCTERRYELTRLEEIEGGYLQQHVLRLVSRSGEKITLHACVVVRVANGRIQRIEEYLDPAPTTKLR